MSRGKDVVCVCVAKRVRGAKDFSALMSRTFIRPSIVLQSDFHSASGSEWTSFNQSDPIMEPTIETT